MRLLRRRHRVSPLHAVIGVVIVFVVGAQLFARDRRVRKVSSSVADARARARWVRSPVLLDSVAQTASGTVTVDEIWVERAMFAQYGLFARPAGGNYLVARVRTADSLATVVLRAHGVPTDTVVLGRRVYALPNQRATYPRAAFSETLAVVRRSLRP